MRAIQFKKSAMTNGYLQFTVPGGNESRGGVFSAASDEPTFMFAGQNELAESIRGFIEARMQRSDRSPASCRRLGRRTLPAIRGTPHPGGSTDRGGVSTSQGEAAGPGLTPGTAEESRTRLSEGAMSLWKIALIELGGLAPF